VPVRRSGCLGNKTKQNATWEWRPEVYSL
jgi:hypothetical protein